MCFSWYTTDAIFFSKRRKFRSSCGNNRLNHAKQFVFRVFSTSGTFFTGASESFVCRWWHIFDLGCGCRSFYQRLAVYHWWKGWSPFWGVHRVRKLAAAFFLLPTVWVHDLSIF
ncbi:T. brucei spp.-specific protein [Trypanosoma brucei gambiense DAL972]|uniref:T. brucei spp.-specific protein n=1 Tax=Trypanosoma brucei gambiense (strain MHOM/CI/86/DAL972) TaxID=679716 RepID=C9ZTD2_TRYB9|nr:T. brucei spp.-specific protein [Trypanosoma brucei gambiense DAL972]CBH12667.1 T. brucei spp.-specific protein [Trypanosoma brucei gambiense DAL972]|eukprot:XP_011774947.1 T. brucei spp.-specific protein [Trypanosoma brucei gambiense DAL972]